MSRSNLLDPGRIFGRTFARIFPKAGYFRGAGLFGPLLHRIIRPLFSPNGSIFQGVFIPPFSLLGLVLLLLSLSSIVVLENLALSLYPSMILAPHLREKREEI